MRGGGLRLSLGLMLLAWVLPGRARAESTSAADASPLQAAGGEASPGLNPEQTLALAKQRYREGVAAYDRELYKDAIDLFLEADRLAPSANLSFNIARAYEKLRDSEHTLAWYRDYLRRAPGAQDRAGVERFVAELAERLREKGVQQVTILSSPPQATVIVDDNPVGVTPWTGQLVPGEHRLSVERREFVGASRRFVLSPATPLDIAVELLAAPASSERAEPGSALAAAAHRPPPLGPALEAAPANAPEQERTRPERSASLGPWITLGAGATSLAAAAAFELARRGAEQRAGKDVVQLEYQRDLEAMQRHQLTARILAMAGAAALLGGGTWLVLDLGIGPAKGVSLSGIGCDAEGCAISARSAF